MNIKLINDYQDNIVQRVYHENPYLVVIMIFIESWKEKTMIKRVNTKEIHKK